MKLSDLVDELIKLQNSREDDPNVVVGEEGIHIMKDDDSVTVQYSVNEEW